MIPRFLNLQGMIGIAVALLLASLFLVKAGEVRHWRKQSGRYEQLYLRELGAGAQTIANYRAAVDAARKDDLAYANRVAAEQRTLSEGPAMTLKHALPLLALALSACSSGRDRPRPLAAVAEQRLCPPMAQPPARLVVPPKKTDFLLPTA